MHCQIIVIETVLCFYRHPTTYVEITSFALMGLYTQTDQSQKIHPYILILQPFPPEYQKAHRS